MRNDELVKTVDAACQFLVQNTRSDRQANHQPKKNDLFQVVDHNKVSDNTTSTRRTLGRGLLRNLILIGYIGTKNYHFTIVGSWQPTTIFD